MSRDSVFTAFIEVRPLEGAKLDPDEIAGAVVRCYVKAKSPADAGAKIRAELARQSLELFHTEWLVDYFRTEWEFPDNEEALSAVKEASETGTVIFSVFECWGHDAPDVGETDFY